jgi:cytochrome P450
VRTTGGILPGVGESELASAPVKRRQHISRSLIERMRASLTCDILRGLIRAEEQGDRLCGRELISQSVRLLIAGFETTIGVIGNGIRALIRHPAELAKLRARPELIHGAVEECLRYEGPIVLTVRILHEDAEFGGKAIPKNSMVWAMLASANRDPERLPDPDTFDIERRDNDHLAFGGDRTSASDTTSRS